MTNPGHDWKLFLVQELCSASLDKIMEAGLFHTLDESKGFIPLGGWKHEADKGKAKKVANLLHVYGSLLDIASGMEYLHERSIIHGDLKPENILTKRDPQNPQGFTCKITDFGLSAMMDPKKTHVSNFRHGTPFYMAPEIFNGQTTTASDVFSFGMLMTELYTGRTPWVYEEGRFLPNLRFIPQLEEDAPLPYADMARSCVRMNPKERPPFAETRMKLRDLLDNEVERLKGSRA